MNCSFCANTGSASVAMPAAAAARASNLRVMFVPPSTVSLRFTRGIASGAGTRPLPALFPHSCTPYSLVRIGPKPQLLLGDGPESGEAVRLLDQKIADERAED